MKDEIWNSRIARLLQEDEAVEQAMGVFEVSSKIEISENNGEKILRR